MSLSLHATRGAHGSRWLGRCTVRVYPFSPFFVSALWSSSFGVSSAFASARPPAADVSFMLSAAPGLFVVDVASACVGAWTVLEPPTPDGRARDPRRVVLPFGHPGDRRRGIRVVGVRSGLHDRAAVFRHLDLEGSPVGAALLRSRHPAILARAGCSTFSRAQRKDIGIRMPAPARTSVAPPNRQGRGAPARGRC